MARTELRLLMLEDTVTEAELALRQLKAGGIVCEPRRVENEADFRKAIAEWQPDLILSDFTLPQFDGLTALSIASSMAPDVPFIFLSGTIGEERAIEALKSGAVDYVLKTNIARLVPAIKRALKDVETRRARRQAENTVEFLANFDALTGLAKRALFCERLDKALKDEDLADLHPAVVVFDVEDMSVINDSCGRHAGDALLQRVAERLKNHFDELSHLAHLGGDVFAGLIPQSSSAESGMQALQEYVSAVFGRPFVVESEEILVSVKSGLARYPDNGEDATTLVQNAEAALKAAKASGEKWLPHRREMNAALAERRALEYRLRAALEKNQFVLYYQPKLSITDHRIIGLEALLRWEDPDRGLIAPGVFLPTLEATGLITPVGEWALLQAAADCRRWARLGYQPLRVAVNVAPQQLRRRDFASRVLGAAAGLTGRPGWGLDIEITESALLEDSAWTARSLHLLRSSGVQVAIDDFGTGYSSLSRLSQLPVDTLKIDRSFTQRLPGEEAARTLVTTIIGLARAFKMSTVAEGVETVEQLTWLAQTGCDESQGFLHSRPVSAIDLELLLSVQAGFLHHPETFEGMQGALFV